MVDEAPGSGEMEAPARVGPHRRPVVPPQHRVVLVAVALALIGVATLALTLPWFDRTGDHIAAVRTTFQPPIDDLETVDEGLSEAQFLFDATVTEPDTVQRVLNLEAVRRQLSLNDAAWRRFRDASVGLPGEAELVSRYEEAMARQADLSGPIGYGLILTPDPSTLAATDTVRELLEVQHDAQGAVRALQRDVYKPERDAELAAAAEASDSGRTVVLVAFAAILVLYVLVAAGTFRAARRSDQARRRVAHRRAVEARRHAFENRLTRALDMASSEPFAYDVLRQAVTEVLPAAATELLLAEGAGAAFHRVLSTDSGGRGPGCRVSSPSACPAAHRGDRLSFPSSRDLDACPYLRERPGDQAAVCQPMSIGGRSLGVVHATFSDGLPDAEALVDLDVLARRAGDRVSLLRAFAESETQARTDPLTGLLNRRSLDEAVRTLEGADVAYCVAYADLDHFKRLNDNWGHEMGDRALHRFARILADGVRPGDLVCRYGGEEFVIVLPECELPEAEAVVQRIRVGMAPVLAEAGLPPFTVSIGLAASTQAPSFAGVVALADAALLRAKADGRDRVVVVGGGPRQLEVGPARPEPDLPQS